MTAPRWIHYMDAVPEFDRLCVFDQQGADTFPWVGMAKNLDPAMNAWNLYWIPLDEFFSLKAP